MKSERSKNIIATMTLLALGVTCSLLIFEKIKLGELIGDFVFACFVLLVIAKVYSYFKTND